MSKNRPYSVMSSPVRSQEFQLPVGDNHTTGQIQRGNGQQPQRMSSKSYSTNSPLIGEKHDRKKDRKTSESPRSSPKSNNQSIASNHNSEKLKRRSSSKGNLSVNSIISALSKLSAEEQREFLRRSFGTGISIDHSVESYFYSDDSDEQKEGSKSPSRSVKALFNVKPNIEIEQEHEISTPIPSPRSTRSTKDKEARIRATSLCQSSKYTDTENESTSYVSDDSSETSESTYTVDSNSSSSNSITEQSTSCTDTFSYNSRSETGKPRNRRHRNYKNKNKKRESGITNQPIGTLTRNAMQAMCDTTSESSINTAISTDYYSETASIQSASNLKPDRERNAMLSKILEEQTCTELEMSNLEMNERGTLENLRSFNYELDLGQQELFKKGYLSEDDMLALSNKDQQFDSVLNAEFTSSQEESNTEDEDSAGILDLESLDSRPGYINRKSRNDKHSRSHGEHGQVKNTRKSSKIKNILQNMTLSSSPERIRSASYNQTRSSRKLNSKGFLAQRTTGSADNKYRPNNRSLDFDQPEELNLNLNYDQLRYLNEHGRTESTFSKMTCESIENTNSTDQLILEGSSRKSCVRDRIRALENGNVGRDVSQKKSIDMFV